MRAILVLLALVAPLAAQNNQRKAPRLIAGSIDHARLGRAHFMAGNWERARSELLHVVGGDQAPLPELFLVARCHEKLGDLDAAEQTFLRVEALAEQRGAGRHWMSAARTARQHIAWMREHGDWQWPARKATK